MSYGKVKHKKFGEGTVINVNKERITVKFGSNIKKFPTRTFNDYFEHNIKDINTIINKMIIEEKIKKAEIEISYKKKQLENIPIRRDYLRGVIVNHCWKCQSYLYSYDDKCKKCGGIICPKCGACLCGFY